MITVTEFNAILLKQAKQILAAGRKVEPPPAPEPEPPAAPAVPDATSVSPEPHAVEPPPASARAPRALASAQISALAEHLKVDESRAARLAEALGVVGNRLDRVRMVRVVKAEGAPQNASKVGEFGYIVDLIGPPQSAHGRDDRGDRGGRRGDRGARGRLGGSRREGGAPGTRARRA
jgi:hypothetical protein